MDRMILVIENDHGTTNTFAVAPVETDLPGRRYKVTSSEPSTIARIREILTTHQTHPDRRVAPEIVAGTGREEGTWHITDLRPHHIRRVLETAAELDGA